MPEVDAVELKRLAAEQLDSTTRLSTRAELRHLPGFLQEGEVVVALAGASFGKWWKAGLAVGTDRRLLLVQKPKLRPAHYEDVPYERMESLRLDVGPKIQDMTLTLSDGTRTLRMIRGSGQELIRALSAQTGGLTRRSWLTRADLPSEHCRLSGRPAHPLLALGGGCILV